MAHSSHATETTLASIGRAWSFLDPKRAVLYADFIQASLGAAAQEALLAMDPAKYEYQSEFAKRYVAEGRVEGRVEGAADIVLKLLALRFGPLPDDVVTRVKAATGEELEMWSERILDADSLASVFAR